MQLFDSHFSSRHDSAATIRASIESVEENTNTVPIPVPSKDNEWLGFCPSAVRLQNGDRKGAFKKRTDYPAAFAASGVTTLYCASKNCVYASNISVDHVWRMVMKDEQRGLKLRWAFLAKSHTPQTKVTGRQYEFQCTICIFSQGHAEGCTWKGVDMFMNHVSTHRGKLLSQEVIDKLKVIDDHIADEKEDFDLNLYPTTLSRVRSNHAEDGGTSSSASSVHLARTSTRTSIVDAIWSRKDSKADGSSPSLPRSQTWRTERDRADSVLSSPPAESDTEQWAIGLSEFRVDREEEYLSPDF